MKTDLLRLRLAILRSYLTNSDVIVINGSLDLSYAYIAGRLPGSLVVHGDLNLSHSCLRSLPDNLSVDGNLDLRDTDIAALPDNLIVGGRLNVLGSLISNVPTSVKIGRGVIGLF